MSGSAFTRLGHGARQPGDTLVRPDQTTYCCVLGDGPACTPSQGSAKLSDAAVRAHCEETRGLSAWNGHTRGEDRRLSDWGEELILLMTRAANVVDAEDVKVLTFKVRPLTWLKVVDGGGLVGGRGWWLGGKGGGREMAMVAHQDPLSRGTVCTVVMNWVIRSPGRRKHSSSTSHQHISPAHMFSTSLPNLYQLLGAPLARPCLTFSTSPQACLVRHTSIISPVIPLDISPVISRHISGVIDARDRRARSSL